MTTSSATDAMIMKNTAWNKIAALWFVVLALAPFGASAADIWAEAVLSEQRPFVQQATVYTVRLYSEQSLKTANVTLPQVNGGMFSKLDDKWSVREIRRGQKTQILNEYRYLFTPLKVGRIDIPAASVVVTTAAAPQSYGQSPTQQWGQQPYNYPGYGNYPNYGQQPQAQQVPAQPQGGGQERLQVSVPALSIEVAALPNQAAAMLPLHSLRIDGAFQNVGEPRVGEPVMLTITVSGVGVTGDRLPAISERFRTDEFKIYAERPHTDWQFDERLQTIVGRRIETLTLVPTHSGPVELPIVEVPWWNVITGQPDVARLTTPGLRVQAAGSGSAQAADPVSQGAAPNLPLRTEKDDLWGFWLPVGGALLVAFLIGWRIGVSQRRQRANEAGGGGPGSSDAAPMPSPWAALTPVAARTRQAAARLMPKTWGARFDEATTRLLQGVNKIIPRRLKIWTCMRCVQRMPEPVGICNIMRRFARDCLGMPENSSLQSIGQAVAGQRPTAETSAYLNLFGRLDDAAYGTGGTGFDIDAWKKDFKRHFGRLLRGSKRWTRSARGGGLPELNPR